MARHLADAGNDVVHVSDIGLLSADDATILKRAGDDDRVVLSADADFGTLLASAGLSKPSFVLLRSADHLTPEAQADLVLANLPTIEDELLRGAIATFARGRLRVRSLPVQDVE